MAGTNMESLEEEAGEFRLFPFSCLWEDAFPSRRRSSPAAWKPRVGLRETDAEYVLELPLPGPLRAEDVRARFESGVLTLTVRKPARPGD